MAKAEMPQLILLDAEMPELDGFEASKAIKADASTAHIPVLICTGHDLSGEPETLKAAGAFGSISKPYNPAQLLAKVTEALNG
jgi:two-component system cell cycle response regulator DivK